MSSAEAPITDVPALRPCICGDVNEAEAAPPLPQTLPLALPPDALRQVTGAIRARDVNTVRELLLAETVGNSPRTDLHVCPTCGGSNLPTAASADSEEAKGADEAPGPLRRCPFDIHRWTARGGTTLLRYAVHNWEFGSALPRPSRAAAVSTVVADPVPSDAAAQSSSASLPPHVKVLELLVGYCGANIRERCQDGYSAVHGACFDGDVESVRFFVEDCGVGVNGEGLYPLLAQHEVPVFSGASPASPSSSTSSSASPKVGWLGRITRSLADFVFSDGRGASRKSHIAWRSADPSVGHAAKPSPLFLAAHDESLPTLTYLLSQGCHVAAVVNVLSAKEKEKGGAADLVDSLDRRPFYSLATDGPLLTSSASDSPPRYSSASMSAVPREVLSWSLSNSTVAVAPSGTMGAAYNPLHAAAIALAPIALQRIIDAGADVLALDEEGRTALEAFDDRFAIRCFADAAASPTAPLPTTTASDTTEASVIGDGSIPPRQPYEAVLVPTPTQELVRSILINEGCNIRRPRTLCFLS